MVIESPAWMVSAVSRIGSGPGFNVQSRLQALKLDGRGWQGAQEGSPSSLVFALTFIAAMLW